MPMTTPFRASCASNATSNLIRFDLRSEKEGGRLSLPAPFFWLLLLKLSVLLRSAHTLQGSPINERGNLVGAVALSMKRDVTDYRSYHLETLRFIRPERRAGGRRRAVRYPARNIRDAWQFAIIVCFQYHPGAGARNAPISER